jgi:adenine phosphoribosyltransferase
MLTHPLEIAGVTRDLPLFEVVPGIKIAVLNILGDVPLIQACVVAFTEKLAHLTFDFIVTAEAKSIPLAYALAVALDKPFVVLRKSYKSYMGEALQTETVSMTTGQPQQLILDEKDRRLIDGKKVLLLDDVVSTGSTLKGMRSLMEKANAEISGEAAIVTEGNQGDWMDIISLGHLPVFT